MALPNDSILVTPGSGATHASHLISSKEYEVWVTANILGRLHRKHDVYYAYFNTAAGFAEAGQSYWDIFNATGSGVTLKILRIIYHLRQAAPADTPVDVEIRRTPSAGGGTVVTPRPLDTGAAALPAGVTMRQINALGTPPQTGALIMQPHFRDRVAAGDFGTIEQYWSGLARTRGVFQPITIPENSGLAQFLTNSYNNYDFGLVFTAA